MITQLPKYHEVEKTSESFLVYHVLEELIDQSNKQDKAVEYLAQELDDLSWATKPSQTDAHYIANNVIDILGENNVEPSN